MLLIRKEIKALLASACLVLSNYARGIEHIKVILVPSDVDMNSLKLAPGRKFFKYSMISMPTVTKEIPIPEDLIGPFKVVSNFHDLYIEDLAFVALALGMPGQSSNQPDKRAFSIE
jgi:hypothetical protein